MNQSCAGCSLSPSGLGVVSILIRLAGRWVQKSEFFSTSSVSTLRWKNRPWSFDDNSHPWEVGETLQLRKLCFVEILQDIYPSSPSQPWVNTSTLPSPAVFLAHYGLFAWMEASPSSTKSHSSRPAHQGQEGEPCDSAGGASGVMVACV